MLASCNFALLLKYSFLLPALDHFFLPSRTFFDFEKVL